MADRFLSHASRRRASFALSTPRPGRYLAVDNGDEVVFIALRPGLTWIGRSPSADVAFDDGSVSHRHAGIMTRTDGRAEIHDDASLNGTWVNEERVRRHVLEPGDTLRVGRRSMRFVVVEAAAAGLEPPTQELACVEAA